MNKNRNEKITEAIQDGIINTAIPKAQWGTGKHHKNTLRPQIFKKLLTKTPSSRDVLSHSSSIEKEKPKQLAGFTRSKSIGNILRPDDNEIIRLREKEKVKEKEKESGSNENGEAGKVLARGRSNSDLKPMIAAMSPPTNTKLLQSIANLIDLTGPGKLLPSFFIPPPSNK